MGVVAIDLPRPTNAELGILRVLWALGPSTVRRVHEFLQGEKATVGYTTVLKFLQIMHGKGLVERDDSERAHVYSAQLSQAAAQRQLTRFLVDNVFDGSSSQLVMQALGGGRASAEELAEIRSLLERLEQGHT
ncbi:MAG: BlaI/MecI/CopY family transcriptional regulator [Proteobacteria bacterium]|nr:BlaI/MecI/CopY family transcriptional regulator [Pseudomonadota bacterium]